MPIFVDPPLGPAMTRARQKQAFVTASSLIDLTTDGRTLAASEPSRRPLVPSSSKGNTAKKRTAPQPASKSKRARREELVEAYPNTPDTVASSPSQSQATATSTRTGTGLDTDVQTPTPTQRRGEPKDPDSDIWLYYIKMSENAKKNKVCECRGCGKHVKGRSTSNFLDHQRKCKGLAKAKLRGIPGIRCPVPDAETQSTIDGDSGTLVRSFTHKEFLSAVMKWIIVSGLPFTTIQNPHLQRAFSCANAEARLQSARSLARRLEDTFDIVNDRVLKTLRNVSSFIHYAHDSWTDSGRKNSYFGIYATYVDDHFEYKEVLIRLIHMKGAHSGERIAQGLFDLFHNVLGVSKRLGPGTGDNASNNRTAAFHLAQLINAEVEDIDIDMRGQDFVGCLCHIANIAALKYIAGEGRSRIPQVRLSTLR